MNENKLSDDDFNYLKTIYNLLSKKGINVEIAPKNVGFMGIKKYIVRCNLVISARMHCSVNSITCGVPTVFLSYSSKSIGMCEFVYGNSSYVIDMNEIIENRDYLSLDKIDSSCDEIRRFLEVRNKELYEMSNNAILYLKEDLCE